MAQSTTTWRRRISLTGGGDGFTARDVFPGTGAGAAITGKIESIIFRQAIGGDATSYLIYIVTNEDPLTSMPDDLDIVLKTTSIASTPSTTVADIDSDVDKPRGYRDGLRVAVDVTTGAGGPFNIICELVGVSP